MHVWTSSAISGLKGVARIPGDKSVSHRALMLGTLASGTTTISGLLESDDVLRTARALISMGAIIFPPDHESNAWRVEGGPLRNARGVLDLGNSGTSARLLMGLIGGQPVQAVLTGDTSLQRRPMGRVIKPLAQMGVHVEATGGDKLPLRIYGAAQLRPIRYTLPVASAQVKSAIMLAALAANGETIITEPVATRDHTERLLAYMGAAVVVDHGSDNVRRIHVTGQKSLAAQSIFVASDPSSAAFVTVAALITPDSDVMMPGVMINPLRAGLYTTLKEMGGDIAFDNVRERSGEPVADIRVRSSVLKGVTVPVERVAAMIDEFPVFCVAAACADGMTTMTGLGELRVKESDRLDVMLKNLQACGVNVQSSGDDLSITGGGHVTGGVTVDSRGDHRIAMSFLVLGMISQQPVTVTHPYMIATSFPKFDILMNGLGARISSVNTTT